LYSSHVIKLDQCRMLIGTPHIRGRNGINSKKTDNTKVCYPEDYSQLMIWCLSSTVQSFQSIKVYKKDQDAMMFKEVPPIVFSQYRCKKIKMHYHSELRILLVLYIFYSAHSSVISSLKRIRGEHILHILVVLNNVASAWKLLVLAHGLLMLMY
jgi:hypothetical protein